MASAPVPASPVASCPLFTGFGFRLAGGPARLAGSAALAAGSLIGAGILARRRLLRRDFAAALLAAATPEPRR
jgi:hypothetical protein